MPRRAPKQPSNDVSWGFWTRLPLWLLGAVIGDLLYWTMFNR